jgi:hypothetical protein
MAMSYDNEDGLLPVLVNDHQEALLAQWHAYRDTMKATNPPPSRLDFGSLTVGPIVNGHAEVTTAVSATWWSTVGGTGWYKSDAYTWRFQTREDNGWQTAPSSSGCAVAPPARSFIVSAQARLTRPANLARTLGTWLRAHCPQLEAAEPPMPVEDRAADTRERLVMADHGWTHE